MVVGFVNSGLMNLRQAINVIMGANIGTTVTAWILSLTGIDSSNIFIKLLKPSSFSPILSLLGIAFFLFSKNSHRRDTGAILLGFATLMFGMDTMSGAVSGLRDVPEFKNLFIMFKSPLLGVLAGAAVTAIIQSSSASIGILQALAVTGDVSYGAAIPIIMGQNIGTCVTAMLSSVGAGKSAKRAALVHLTFNVLGTAVWLGVFWAVKLSFRPPLLDAPASLFGIAAVHFIFNILCTLLMLPLSGFLEHLVCRLVPDGDSSDVQPILDERLLSTPPIALSRCFEVECTMAQLAASSMTDALLSLTDFSDALAASIRKAEEETDRYEDILGTYLVSLSSKEISSDNSSEAAKLLRLLGDFERIADHAVNVLEASEELKSKGLSFTSDGTSELAVMTAAVREILRLTLASFINDDMTSALLVEPLEQVIDSLKDELRTRHIARLQSGKCSIEAGFVFLDLLTNLERTADHCSNIAACVYDMKRNELNLHESLRALRSDDDNFRKWYNEFSQKYSL
jgi:phosphate:Na+ symporter